MLRAVSVQIVFSPGKSVLQMCIYIFFFSVFFHLSVVSAIFHFVICGLFSVS